MFSTLGTDGSKTKLQIENVLPISIDCSSSEAIWLTVYHIICLCMRRLVAHGVACCVYYEEEINMSYTYFQLDVTNKSLAGDLSIFTPNGEWEVIGFPNRRHAIYYDCCPEPQADVSFYLTIRRKPLYNLFNLILPCIFITATTILVFYLPAESGEKVIINVFMLL